MDIRNVIRNMISESYKLTFQDKKNIDDSIRKGFESELNRIKNDNQKLLHYKSVVDVINNSNYSDDEKKVILNSPIGILSTSQLEKIINYNAFYLKNYDRYKADYIRQKQAQSLTSFDYKSKSNDKLSKINIDSYYGNLNKVELDKIQKFLRIAQLRQHSGTGTSVDRTAVRDAFFETPTTFQKLFAEIPSKYLWRGDDVHPCSKEYSNDVNYLAMQSFSTNKSTAQNFGSIIFPASRIKSYRGSFSIPLFLQYGLSDVLFDNSANFSDEEGEIFFFDVIYHCEKTF